MRAAAGIGADQDPAPQQARQLRQPQAGSLNVVGGGVRDRVAGPGTRVGGSPFPSAPWST
jgi:hypothetical protein